MKKQLLFTLLILLSINCLSQSSNKYKTLEYHINSVGKVNDTIYQIADGITAKVSQYEKLYNTPQHITLMEIESKKYHFSFLNHHGMKKTSDMAVANNEIVAMNGTFYDMSQGNSVCYLQINGMIEDTTRFEDFYPQINGALKIKKGRIKIIDWSPKKERIARFNRENRRLKKRESIMVAQPMLIRRGKRCKIPGNMPDFNDTKHNRSVLFTRGNKVYFLIVDGRKKGFAEGMTIDELQDFLISLRAEDAINLDGGGSSTLWAKDFANLNDSQNKFVRSGIINYPSDRNGERSIANHVAVKPLDPAK